jgi:hypothetical protein
MNLRGDDEEDYDVGDVDTDVIHDIGTADLSDSLTGHGEELGSVKKCSKNSWRMIVVYTGRAPYSNIYILL